MRTATALLVLVAFAVGASPAPAARQDRDIVDTATAAGDFTTLTTLLERAGLVEALKEPGPYTVFAPTDAAFAKVPKHKLDALEKNRKRLRSVLLYHVVGKKLTAAQIVERKRAKTLNGKKVRFRVRDSRVHVKSDHRSRFRMGASVPGVDRGRGRLVLLCTCGALLAPCVSAREQLARLRPASPGSARSPARASITSDASRKRHVGRAGPFTRAAPDVYERRR
jgi:Fasciclin domain